MATGFRFSKNSRPIYLNCFATWYAAKGNMEVAFKADGPFTASVTNPRIHFREDTTHNAVLVVGEEGGNGFIENPVFKNGHNIHDITYKKYLTGRELWKAFSLCLCVTLF